MLTAHQLAKLLLDGPDLPVYYPDHEAACLESVPIDEVQVMGEIVLIK